MSGTCHLLFPSLHIILACILICISRHRHIIFFYSSSHLHTRLPISQYLLFSFFLFLDVFLYLVLLIYSPLLSTPLLSSLVFSSPLFSSPLLSCILSLIHYCLFLSFFLTVFRSLQGMNNLPLSASEDEKEGK